LVHSAAAAAEAAVSVKRMAMADDRQKLRAAMVLHQQGRLQEAAGLYRELIGRNPRNADALHYLGTIEAAQGRLTEARALIERSLAGPKLNVAFLENYATVLFQLGDHRRALEACANGLKLNPHSANFLYVGAVSLYKLNRLPESLAQFDALLSVQPNHVAANNEKSSVLAEMKRFDAALAAVEKALALDPRYAEAHLNKANICSRTGRLEESLAAYDKALSLNPKLADAWLGRGNSLRNLKRYDEAFAAYDKALALKPGLEGAWLGRGNVLFELNRDAEALACYEQALTLKPGLPDALFNKAFVKLSLGEFEEGWKLYEWRWQSENFSSPLRNFPQPLWLGGESLAGKTILVHAEQGFGDTIQFSRYLAKVRAENRKIVFEVQPPLRSLFASLFPDMPVIARGDALPQFDWHCPLLSLPLAFKTTLDTIPAEVPYIAAPPEKQQIWQDMLGPKSKPRIGLAWSGKAHPDINRSIPLQLLLPLMSEAAEFHSLQKDVKVDDVATLAANPIADHCDRLTDFSETAALIAQLDLVISIDTAVAHLAAAIGMRTWILLPFHPDFRWLRERADCPWYPTARLFRQRVIGDWPSVIASLKPALAEFLDGTRREAQ
jgi:tetratricopeptide (TPR) repeat protein